MSTGRESALSICALPALAQDFGAGPSVVRAQFDAEEVAHLAVEVGDVGLRPADHADLDVALRPPDARPGCARQADLPVPGSPVTTAKPPSAARWRTRRQKESMRGETCNASAGTPGANGFHLSP